MEASRKGSLEVALYIFTAYVSPMFGHYQLTWRRLIPLFLLLSVKFCFLWVIMIIIMIITTFFYVLFQTPWWDWGLFPVDDPVPGRAQPPDSGGPQAQSHHLRALEGVQSGDIWKFPYGSLLTYKVWQNTHTNKLKSIGRRVGCCAHYSHLFKLGYSSGMFLVFFGYGINDSIDAARGGTGLWLLIRI